MTENQEFLTVKSSKFSAPACALALEWSGDSCVFEDAQKQDNDTWDFSCILGTAPSQMGQIHLAQVTRPL